MPNVFKIAKTMWKKPANRKKSWASMVKEAGRKMRGGTKRKKVGRVKSASSLRKELKASRTRLPHGYQTAKRSRVSGVANVSHNISLAKAGLKQQIAWAEVQKFTASKAASKRKIAKKIADLKRRYKKLC